MVILGRQDLDAWVNQHDQRVPPAIVAEWARRLGYGHLDFADRVLRDQEKEPNGRRPSIARKLHALDLLLRTGQAARVTVIDNPTAKQMIVVGDVEVYF